MNIELKNLKNVVAENCITVILNTHRTRPDNSKDPINLKNLISNTEQRLSEDESKKDVRKLISSLQKLADSIDHNQNIESLILFVNEDVSQYVRLPIPVEDRVVIDTTFATRDLVRALHSQSEYYILLLNQNEARLIEAFNDKFVEEVNDVFPFENVALFSTKKTLLSNSGRQTNLVAEFFNRVDKEVNKKRKDKPLPVLICTDDANYSEYLKIADEKDSIFKTYLSKNRLDEKNHVIVEQAWEVIREYIEKENLNKKTELSQAITEGKFLNEIKEIWEAINQGRIKTLFIEQGLFQPAILEENKLKLVSDDQRDRKEVIDDIYDEMIELNMGFGGDVVFLPKGELKEFNGFGAITRY